MEKSYAQYCLDILKKEKRCKFTRNTIAFPDHWIILIVGTYGYKALVDSDLLDFIYTDDYGYSFYSFKED